MPLLRRDPSGSGVWKRNALGDRVCWNRVTIEKFCFIGKTAAFMLPVLERLLYRPVSTPIIRILCLVPTRELAVQVYTVTQQLAKYTKIRVCLAAGISFLKNYSGSKWL